MQKLPYVLSSYKLTLPDNLEYWITKGDKLPILKFNALSYPKIYLDEKDILYDEEEIYYEEKGYLYKFNIKSREKIKISDKPAEGFIFQDEKIIPVNSSVKALDVDVIKVHKNLDVLVIEGKKDFLIYFNRTLLNTQKPKEYYLTKDFISLIYNKKTIAIDKNAMEKIEIPLEGAVIGKSLDNKFIIKGKNGIIYLFYNSQFRILGICSYEATYLGELGDGYIIVCGDQVKLYSKESWSYIGKTNRNIGHANGFYGIISLNGKTLILNENLIKLGELKEIYTAYILHNKAYVLSKDIWIGILELNRLEEPFQILNQGYSYKICGKGNQGYVTLIQQHSELYISKSSDENCYSIEPKNIVVNEEKNVSIKLSSPFYLYEVSISIELRKPSIELLSKSLLVSLDGGRTNLDNSKNALLTLKISYNIPTDRKINLLISIDNDTIRIPLQKNSDIIEIEKPLNLYNLDEKILKFSIEHENIIEQLKEYLIKPEEVKKPKYPEKIETFNEIKDLECISKTVYKDKKFSWLALHTSICDYNGIYLGKIGDTVSIDGKTFRINNNYEEIEIARDGYTRHYILIGISDPVKVKDIRIVKDSLHIEFDTRYPIEVQYGFHACRGYINSCNFPLDPITCDIVFKSYVGNLVVKTELKIEECPSIYLRKAILNANELKKHFENLGLL